MKRLMAMLITVAMVGALAGIAYAQGPHGPGRMGMGWGAAQGEQGPGGMGGRMAMMHGRMAGGGPEACPFMGAAGTETPAAATEAVTEDKAKELATAYVDKYLKGFTIERVLPFQGRRAMAYQVELKGPKGEKRILHVNPWGHVRPFGPLAQAD
jgi:hypothetical protein